MITMDTPTENHGKRLLKFQWGMAELRKDLANWSGEYSVTVTLNSDEPGTETAGHLFVGEYNISAFH